jgi:hypothetical protein
MPALGLAMRLLVWPAVGVAPAPPSVVAQPLLHDLAAFVRADPQGIDDWPLLERAGDRRAWHGGYDCQSLHALLNQEGFEPARLEGHLDAVRALWGRQLRRRPDVWLQHRACTAGLAWSVADSWVLTVSPTVEPNRHGLELRPVSAGLHEAQFQLLEWSRTGWRRAWLWRSPRWMYAALALLALGALRRRDASLLVPLAPALGHAVAVALANPAWDARYCALAGLLSVLLLPLGIAHQVRKAMPQPVS